MFFVIDWFFRFFGNFGVAILAVTVCVKLIFFPLANKSYRSMSAMKKVQPKMTEIRERYKDDKVKQQQALMELYKTEKINPLAGCWPVALQIPVFFSLYKVLFVTIEMRHAPFFGWIQDLSAPDPTHIFNLFGLLPVRAVRHTGHRLVPVDRRLAADHGRDDVPADAPQPDAARPDPEDHLHLDAADLHLHAGVVPGRAGHLLGLEQQPVGAAAVGDHDPLGGQGRTLGQHRQHVPAKAEGRRRRLGLISAIGVIAGPTHRSTPGRSGRFRFPLRHGSAFGLWSRHETRGTPMTGIANADELTRLAFAHCLFPLAPADKVRQEGPRIYASGSGCRLIDIHGVERLDMMSSHTRANTLGYGNREIAEAVYDQMTRLHYVGTTSHFAEPTIRLAAKLAELAPGRLARVAFTSGGSESVESALKLAKQYQKESGRKPRAYKTISRWTAYHGSTMGALSVTDWLAVREVFEPRVPGHSFIPNPTRYRNPFGMDDDSYADFCATYLERQIELEGPETVAAFIGEAVMQAHGVQIPPKHYWDRVRAICDAYGVVLIVDEVITGFGRTGAWFASEHFSLEPDIMTMAKALSAGYAPIGAVITRDEIADAVPFFRHVNTFAGHASAAAAANATIAIKERDGLIAGGREKGARFGRELAAALGNHPIVGQVRGIGLWQCVDFTADRKTKAKFTDDTVQAIVARMHDLGVLASAIGTALEMAPPLIATDEELDRAVAVCARAVHEIARERGLA